MSHDHDLPENVSEQFLLYMKNPINIGQLDSPGGTARMIGQCGDAIGVHATVTNGVIEAISVQPDGCAYTVVCAEAMSRLAKGLTVDKALELEPEDIAKEVGGLPEDHMHCARLALNSMGEAIADNFSDN